MSPQLRLAVLIALATAAFGCKEPNTLFCEGHPDDPDCVMGGDDAPPATCSASNPCPDNGICENEVCRQCIEGQTANCGGTTPLCDTTNKVCVGCTEHAQCVSSEACLPSGACAMPGEVAYVRAGAGGNSGSGCEMGLPCPTLTAALMTGKKTIKVLAGGIVVNAGVADINSVTGLVILADKTAQMSVGPDQDLLKIGGNSTVEIYDLTLRNTAALGNDKHAVIIEGSAAVTLSRLTINNNQGLGIRQNGGTLVLTQSNIHSNARGGLDVANGRFTVMNNFFFNNGDNLTTPTSFGGVSLNNVLATDVFEFNSIARNKAGEGNVAGVFCNGTGGAFVLRNNIVFDNLDTTGAAVQIFANGCTVRKNIEGPGAASADNIAADPLFMAIGAGNLRLQAGSPAKNASEMTAVSPAVDIEGEPRPVPSGQNPDIGADEIATP